MTYDARLQNCGLYFVQFFVEHPVCTTFIHYDTQSYTEWSKKAYQSAKLSNASSIDQCSNSLIGTQEFAIK